MTERDLARIADRFWRSAGGRDVPLAEAAEAALPAVVVELPAVTTRLVVGRLRREGIEQVGDPADEDDRPLRGCVFASRGHGQLFVRAGEGPFTLAHEVAHFLLHYQLPRQRAVELAGPAVVAVLDGDRPPTDGERLSGALGLVDVGQHLWLFDAEGEHAAEREADALADRLLGRPRRRRAAGPDPLLGWAREVLVGGGRG